MVAKKVAQGDLDEYIHMILCTVLKSCTYFYVLFLTFYVHVHSIFFLLTFQFFFLADYNPQYVRAYQTEVSHFAIDAQFMPAWTVGLELLGRPMTARLTSFEKKQFLDLYYQ